jgi:hypothetical protein
MRVVRWKVDGGVSACGFSVNSLLNVAFVSVDRKVQVVYEIIFFWWQFELEVFINIIYVILDILFICFVLVEDVEDIIYISFVIYYFFIF